MAGNRKALREGVKSELETLSKHKPHKATKVSRSSLKAAKKDYKLQKDNYKALKLESLEQSKKDSLSPKEKMELDEKLAKSKEALLKSKNHRKVVAKAHKKTLKNDPKSLRNKSKQLQVSSAKRSIRQQIKKSLSEDDTLAEAVDQYNKVKDLKFKSDIAISLGKTSARASFNTIKGVNNIASRFSNFSKGRGFTKTPSDMTARAKMAKRARNFRNRITAAKKVKQSQQGLSMARQVLAGKMKITKALTVIFGNPYTWIIFGIVLIFFVISSALTSVSSIPIKQDEFQLTDSWSYLTKIDADNSDSSNSFFTPLDDVMYYMNDQFDDYDMKDFVTVGNNSAAQPNQTYEQYLTGLWSAMNGASPDYKLTSMNALEKDKSSKYYLSDDNYSDMKEREDEVGYSSLDGQLEFPYKTDNLVITRRYGYEKDNDKVKLHSSIGVSNVVGQELFAPMGGIVNSITVDDTLTISEYQDARITITGVNTGRFQGGEKIEAGTLLGNASKSGISISYEKYNDDTKKWVSVNPAFYFPKVTYTQFTSLSSDSFDPGKSVTERATAVYNFLTKLGYKKEGISAILGCWSEESEINPKRAEGDYLSPPVGASGNSWDDISWLNMGDNEIYHGQFPNIVHRGLGLGQWTDTADGSTRHTMLLDYAKAKSKKWYDLYLQLDFMVNGDTAGNQTMFKNTASNAVSSSIPELTNYFLTYWEGNPGNKLQERVQAAQNWFTYFSNNGGSDADMSASSKELFEKYKDKIIPLPSNKETQEGQGWPGNGYEPGNCTWYVYNRQAQIGHNIDGYMGNGGQWGYNYTKTPGATIDSKPQVGDAVSFSPGVAGSSSQYGHVAQVEVVNPDGTFLVSEMNTLGLYSMGYRMFQPGAGMTFVHFK